MLFDGNNVNIIAPTSLHKISKDDYKPIGVVVVPGNHNVYGDNSCGVMSLVCMDCANPTTGSLNKISISWGANVDITEILNGNKCIVELSNGTLSTQNFGYLARNGVWAATGNYKIPDPYNEDGSRNANYYNTTVSAYNAMSDFKGEYNTQAIITKRGSKNYNQWVPEASTVNDYAAASCCHMFYTEGTQQG